MSSNSANDNNTDASGNSQPNSSATATTPTTQDDSVPQPDDLYFCHICQQEIDDVRPDFTCPICGQGFLERLEGRTRGDSDLDTSGDPADAHVHDDDFSANLFQQLLMGAMGAQANRQTQQQPNQQGAASSGGASGGGTATGGPRQNAPNTGGDAITQFIQQLMTNLNMNMDGAGHIQFQFQGGGADDHGGFQFTIPPMQIHGDPRDYAWGPAGLDQIVTQLLNQFEGGQPPMTREQIDRLPRINVDEATVAKSSQCTTCFDDFTIGEEVRQLPCKHIFHNDCIVPWLERHGTCPICRQSVTSSNTQSTTAGNASGGSSQGSGQPPPPSGGSGGRTVMEEIDELD